MSRPRVLIEDWLPIAEIGVESRRERAVASALPPIYFLHTWWARRPLVASRAAVLGSLLPAWDPNNAELTNRFESVEGYRAWFLSTVGITGDPVAARERIRKANELGIQLDKGYDGPRAFTHSPDAEEIAAIDALTRRVWGGPAEIADTMAGGGSIPFESMRLGLRTHANELNPVAALILHATLRLPSEFGPEFATVLSEWGTKWIDRVEERLKSYFPRRSGESILGYIHANTVACPDTGKPSPLAPNWWLSKGAGGWALQPLVDVAQKRVEFTLLRTDELDGFDPMDGTIARGNGRSLWTGTSISSAYIKSEAQAGRLGSQLIALAIDTPNGRGFRLPDEDDMAALASAERESDHHRNDWMQARLIPNEAYPEVSSDMRPRLYGMASWSDFFSGRQILSLATMVDELRKLELEAAAVIGEQGASALITYFALSLDVCATYNSRSSRWDPERGIRNNFERHDYSFKWTYAEWDAAHNLLKWAIEQQLSDAYTGIASLLLPEQLSMGKQGKTGEVDITRGDAGSLPYADGQITAVVVDPPYYDNVQYAELSDFFYVWEKLTLSHLYQDLFVSNLTDKDSEAVANPARFKRLDAKRAKVLAKEDYERKMTRIFAEANRVLREDGVLTVMFTHKRVEAWDTLGTSLIEAGFEIESSWPIHTESEHSQHQARKASAASTIVLACRKRQSEQGPVWWDDLAGEVRRVAREKAEEFLAAGIDGVDLYISTFGPALSVISRQWPVYTSEVDPETGEPRSLRPEEALDLAREEVADLRRRGLLLGRDVEFDPVTDWYLLAWDAFGAIEFPYDEARKLALALGLDLDGELVRLRVVSKKASSVILQEPKQRRRPGLADPEEASFVRLLDAAHALMVAHQEDGVRGAESFLKRTRLSSDARFQALLQALANAIPRTKLKGRFVRPEAAALDGLAVLFPDLVFPEEPEIVLEPTQAVFDLGDGSSDDSEDSDDDVDEDD